MIEIAIRGLEKIQKDLQKMEDQIPFALALGLTKVAQKVKVDQQAEMRRVFDRPTRFTLNSLFINRATKSNPEAILWFKDRWNSSHHYLAPQIYGGKREYKRLEKLLSQKGRIPRNGLLVPGKGVRLNKFGNVSRGRVQQVLSSTRSQFDPYNNETQKSKKRNLRKGNRGYFAIKQKKGKLIPGIYQRKAKKKVRSIFISVNDVNYKKRYDFFGMADKSIATHYQSAMDEAFMKAINTAR